MQLKRRQFLTTSAAAAARRGQLAPRWRVCRGVLWSA